MCVRIHRQRPTAVLERSQHFATVAHFWALSDVPGGRLWLWSGRQYETPEEIALNTQITEVTINNYYGYLPHTGHRFVVEACCFRLDSAPTPTSRNKMNFDS